MNALLSSELRCLKGVGLRRQEAMAELDLHTVADLLTFFPLRYLTNDSVRPIASMVPQQTALLQVEVCGTARVSYLSGQRSVVTLPVRDESAAAYAVWFNQAYRRLQFTPGDRIWLRARLELLSGQRRLSVRECGVGSAPEPGLQPIYALRGLLAQKQYAKLVEQALVFLETAEGFEPWPEKVRHVWGLPGLEQALRLMHLPTDANALEQARRRLAIDEVGLNHALIRLGYEAERGLTQMGDAPREQTWRQDLPYTLTSAQERCIVEISTAQADSAPMRRLLQGDVGAGKTVVAAAAALRAVYSGCQAVLLAPTEILAYQHRESIRALLPQEVLVHLVVARGDSRERRQLRQNAAAGLPGLWVGTHALLSEGLRWTNLGLVIVDEQHRFGVSQRQKLLEGRAPVPDLLCLSATPIPRSLAMALYGDLALSTLDQRPRHRAGTKTIWLRDPGRLAGFIDFCKHEIDVGHKLYWVCPSIGADADLSLASLQEREPVLRRFWPTAELRALHGRLSEVERSQIMSNFLHGKIDILLGTTVIEVGIDQPLATVMVVENAERFGLAQLHQLRGRVGRGNAPAYCVLLAGTLEQLQNDANPDLNPQALERIKALCASDDGFALARLDLELRGPGEVFGLAQSGFAESFALRWPLSLEDVERIDQYLQTLTSEELRDLVAKLSYFSKD